MSLDYNNILNISNRSVLNTKITKAFFLRNFHLSASEKKTLASIQSMLWLASIKPHVANIQQVENKQYKYEEIQIMICTVADNKLDNNVWEKHQTLFQKHITYQIILIIENHNEFVINTCDKRINLNDTSKRTIENYYTTPVISKLYKNDISSAFFKAIDYSQLNKTNLETTYKSYINAVIQYQTANITGSFIKRPQKRTASDMQNLLKIETLEKDIISLKSQIKKESQLNKKVELNITLQSKRANIDEIKNKLSK